MARRRRFSEEPFGPTIEQLMAETGNTYRALAAKTELSAGYLNHLVHGNRPVPSNEVVETLARALDVGPEYFREYRLRKITTQLESMPEVVDREHQGARTAGGEKPGELVLQRPLRLGPAAEPAHLEPRRTAACDAISVGPKGLPVRTPGLSLNT
jgi:transcriptional regulator with XRE-family HTH domain